MVVDLTKTIKISDDLNTLERWDKIGILEGLSDEKKILAANCFEFTIKYLLNSDNNTLEDSDNNTLEDADNNTLEDSDNNTLEDLELSTLKDLKLATIVFPIIYRIIREVEIGVNDLMFIIKNTKDNIPNLIDYLNNNIDEYIDYEAEYCIDLANELILHIKNNKKE